MTGDRLDLQTADGAMDCYAFTAGGPGPWPAVIVYMDAFGIRPQLGDMAQRLASNGYCVVLPNLYYRTGPFAPFDRQAALVEGPERDRFKAMIQSITTAMVMRDTGATIDVLDSYPSARPGRIGVVGYCMGGGYALAAAGTFPDRIAAVASFHGGSLATDKPDSPHTFARHIRARAYIGAAEIDPSFPEEQKERLRRALTEAGVDYTLDTYIGAKHGFAVTGHLVYDHEASERHWTKLLELLNQTLHEELMREGS
jgi:carboxymethylenebutenolidase